MNFGTIAIAMHGYNIDIMGCFFEYYFKAK